MNISAVLTGLGLLGLTLCAHAQTVRRVPADFPTIQQAIDACLSGDIVRIAPGKYFERLDIGGKRLTLESSGGPDSTIIDATYLGPVLKIGPGATRQTVVQGLTLTHGRDLGVAGGIVITDASPTIQGNIIIGNLGGGEGNGITATNSSALIQYNRIAGNINSGQISGGGGAGGIGLNGWRCSQTPTVCAAELRYNIIEDNAANSFSSGGGISIWSGMPRIIGNVIRRNSTRNYGGGIALLGDNAAHIENNLIAGNRLIAGDWGGGVYLTAGNGARGPYFINNTVVGNEANGEENPSAVFLDNFAATTRLANNLIIAAPGQTAIDCSRGPLQPQLAGNNVVADGGTAYRGTCSAAAGQQGNISTMPQFLAAGDYRLAPGSAGVDGGINAYSSEPLDLAFGARIVGTVDIGAYELADALFSDGLDP
jgi:hypothetical protein